MRPDLDRRYRWYRIRLTKQDKTPGDYYFRGATAQEMRLCGLRAETIDGEDVLLERCVVPPEPTDWYRIRAGVPARLVQEILRVTGWTEEGVPQMEAMEWVTSEEGGAEALAIAFIPGLDLVKLREANPGDYWRYIFVGKMMFENMYSVQAGAAFGNAQAAAPVQGPAVMNPETAVSMLTPNNPRAVVTDGGFSWSRGS